MAKKPFENLITPSENVNLIQHIFQEENINFIFNLNEFQWKKRLLRISIPDPYPPLPTLTQPYRPLLTVTDRY